MRNNSAFYIMSAGCLVGNKAVTVEGAHSEWAGEEGTIIVAQRERGYDKFSKIFIHGCAGDYDVTLGESSSYTQDTGNGYACVGYELKIENIIQVAKDGTITSENDIGLNEKRRLWVMK